MHEVSAGRQCTVGEREETVHGGERGETTHGLSAQSERGEAVHGVSAEKQCAG